MYGTALGVLIALVNDGWHRMFRMQIVTYTSITQGLVFGVLWGAFAGFLWYWHNERDIGKSLLTGKGSDQ